MTICSSCHAGCCRRFNINLTGYDILKISKTLGLDMEYFIQVNPVEDEDVERISRHAALFKFSDIDENRFYRFCLSLIDSDIFVDSSKCIFLQEWDSKLLRIPQMQSVVSRCGVYENRPLACSIYPADLDQSGLAGVTGDPNLFCEKSDNPAYNLCPRPVNSEDFADYTGNTIHKLILFRYEMDYFKLVAESWNESPGTLTEFVNFLQTAYENRIIFYEIKPKKEPQ